MVIIIEEAKTKLRLNELIEQAAEHLKSLRYLPDSIKLYQRIWAKLALFAQKHEADFFDIDLGHRFLHCQYGLTVGHETKKVDHVRSRAIRILSDFQLSGAIIKKICKKTEPFPEQFEKVFNEYLQSLRNEERPRSRIQTETLHLRYFGSYLEQKAVREFSDLTREDINGFMLTLSCFAKNTISHILRSIRNLLEYAHKNGFHPEDISDVCPVIRLLQKTKIPSAYTFEEVESILKAVDRGNGAGKRDYAILLLAARYGIRAGDIRELKFTDFDWDSSKFSLTQQKTKKAVDFEISDELGQALIDYLKYGRPESSDQRIFIRHAAPYIGFSDTYKFHNIINKYMTIAGIKIPPSKRHGLHSLRHSLASRMLEQEVPITTIADVLSHSYIDTTAIYTKIDIPQLRLCALEVPYEAD